MEGDGEEASSPQEDTPRFSFFTCNLANYLCRKYGISGKKTKSYTLVSLLLKSEVLYALYVWYVCGVIATQRHDHGWHAVQVQRWLPYLWILKPVFAFLDDSMDRILKQLSVMWRYLCEGSGNPDKIGLRLGRRRCFIDDVLDFNQRFNIVLVISEIGILALVPLMYYFFYINPSCMRWGLYTVVGLALCQIAASASCEGAFCRYVQCNSELSEVQFISLRQMLVAGYGVSTLVCILWPCATSLDFLFSPLALMNIYPLFLVSNTVCVLWVVFSDDAGYEEAVDMSRRSETSWSPKTLFAFLTLMCMALDLRYRYVFGAFRRFQHPYVVLVSTLLAGQVLKMIISYICARHVTLQGLINIAKFIFVLMFVLTFATHRIVPLPSESSSTWYLFSVIFCMTVIQHLLITFGLALSVRTAPTKLESTITSLTDVVMDVVSFMYRERLFLRPFALKFLKYDAVFDSLTSFFCLYSFFVLFAKPQIEALLYRGSMPLKIVERPRLPQLLPVSEEASPIQSRAEHFPIEVPPSVINSQALLQDPDADKSPWGVESDYSNTSD
ncbi:hypothetical protein X943_003966 [Babesia divergens]|uniref:Transmembrane protein n=1 Tax=Babesia divergens TaxID=32595 RepID=A0AAD9GKZ5_BABDI|nr:hypothetical protein X943_003966 [Babesia divergens]